VATASAPDAAIAAIHEPLLINLSLLMGMLLLITTHAIGVRQELVRPLVDPQLPAWAR
jgi:hypothetical protein